MNDLEFLPERHIRARQNQRLRLTRLWLLIVLAVSMICWAVYSRARIASAEAQLNDARRTVNDYRYQVQMVNQLRAQQTQFEAREKLVAKLTGNVRRTELLVELCKCLPEQVVLTRLEIDRQMREAQSRPVVPAAQSRPRGPAKVPQEAVDRIRVEGFAADDLSLARFLQNVSGVRLFEQGDLGFSKDAKLRDRDVRVFAATFYAPVDRADEAGMLDASILGRRP